MYSYFHKTKLDEDFYNKRISSELPDRIIDAHAHFNLAKHVENVSKETIAGDWALECGMVMPYEDAQSYMSIMFPGKKIDFVTFPWPLRDADTEGNNEYIASLIKEKGTRGLYTLRPEYSVKKIEKDYVEGHFSGFKPYPYMANPTKGAEISIFDFMTHEQFALANQLKASVVMHLPRIGRLPDPNNISEIRVIINKYPDVKLVVAHFGRCFNHEYFEEALEVLRDDVHRFWFDTSAVLNPKVYKLAFTHLDYKRILHGTDIPIFLWHGKREWNEKTYTNLCRENFSWNTHKYRDEEENYTFFIYEQINNTLLAINECFPTNSDEVINCVFRQNAEAVYVLQT